MISKFKKSLQLAFAVLVGAGAIALIPSEASAQSGTTTICYRGLTLTMPTSIAQRYFAAGATPGPCGYGS